MSGTLARNGGCTFVSPTWVTEFAGTEIPNFGMAVVPTGEFGVGTLPPFTAHRLNMHIICYDGAWLLRMIAQEWRRVGSSPFQSPTGLYTVTWELAPDSCSPFSATVGAVVGTSVGSPGFPGVNSAPWATACQGVNTDYGCQGWPLYGCSSFLDKAPGFNFRNISVAA